MLEIALGLVLFAVATVAVIALIGFVAAVLSKVTRDARESRLRELTSATAELLASPANIKPRELRSWCRSGGQRRVAVLRALERVTSAGIRSGSIGDAVPHRDELLACLAEQARARSPIRRGTAVLLAGHLASDRDCHMLAVACEDPDLDVRMCAIASLGRLGSAQAFDALAGLLDGARGSSMTPLEHAAIIDRMSQPEFAEHLAAAADAVGGSLGGRADGLRLAAALSRGRSGV